MVHIATELAKAPIGQPAPETASPVASHTPGPWLVDGTCFYFLDWDGESYEGKGKDYRRMLTNRFFGSVQGTSRRIPKEELLANARLAAGAPELLRCLQQLHDDIAEYARINNLGGYDNHVMRQAREAITAATGSAA